MLRLLHCRLSANYCVDRRAVHAIPAAMPRSNNTAQMPAAALQHPANPTFVTDAAPPPKATRVVIPSKRAAQNRAAQRAFRQRRDKYVKDLEQKVKEMESWPEEMERLREENKRLRESVTALEQRLAQVSGPGPGPGPGSGQQQRQQAANSDTEAITPQQAPIVSEQQPPASSSSSSSSPPHPLSPPPAPSISEPQSSQTTNPLLPVPLRQPNFAPPPPAPPAPTNSHAPSTSPVVMEHNQTTMESDTGLVQPDALPPDFWTFNNADLEFAFDSFFKDDFTSSSITGNGDDSALYTVNNSGQVLDDLVAMLQTRQRPQLPLETNPSDLSASQQDLSSSSSSFILHQQMPMQHQ